MTAPLSLVVCVYVASWSNALFAMVQCFFLCFLSPPPTLLYPCTLVVEVMMMMMPNFVFKFVAAVLIVHFAPIRMHVFDYAYVHIWCACMFVCSLLTNLVYTLDWLSRLLSPIQSFLVTNIGERSTF